MIIKKIAAVLTLLLSVTIQAAAQEETYDAKYSLTQSTVTRDAKATLYITNGAGNTFTGVFAIDGQRRSVFGWYTRHISEGGNFVYNTEGIAFYVDLKIDFQHQQLFKGLFNYNKTKISGTYFFWGNEFNFTAEKE